MGANVHDPEQEVCETVVTFMWKTAKSGDGAPPEQSEPVRKDLRSSHPPAPCGSPSTTTQLTGSGSKGQRVNCIVLAESVNPDWFTLEGSGERNKWGGGWEASGGASGKKHLKIKSRPLLWSHKGKETG